MVTEHGSRMWHRYAPTGLKNESEHPSHGSRGRRRRKKAKNSWVLLALGTSRVVRA